LARILEPDQWIDAKRVVIACWGGKMYIRRVDAIDNERIYLRADNPMGKNFNKRLSDITWMAQATTILQGDLE